jgi:hypothetical protein
MSRLYGDAAGGMFSFFVGGCYLVPPLAADGLLLVYYDYCC